MIYLNLCAPSAEIGQEEREEIFAYFGEGEREYIESKKNTGARLQSLGGLLSLMRLSSKKMKKDSLGILRKAGKKPEVLDASFEFNISHSHSLSLCAVGSGACQRIGVDIERIDRERKVELISKRFFTEAEKEILAEDGNSCERFFLLWSAKEARAKMSGEGLSRLLAMEDIVESCVVRSFFVEYNDEKYVLCVATALDEECEFLNTNKDIKIISL